MRNLKMKLSFENRLHLNKTAGNLSHVFGEGYFIYDEYGREVNAFEQEKDFNRLIKKFKYRHLLIENFTQNIKGLLNLGKTMF
jgi:hypothetical protein